MPIYIEMPKLSDTMSEGTVAKWLKQAGDTVASGDVIAEIETDKATMEMEAFDDGVLHKTYVGEGQKVAVGTRLAVLLEEGEAPPADDDGEDGAAQPADARPGAKPDTGETAEGEGEDEDEDEDEDKGAPSGAGEGEGRVKASPLARKIAAESGVDLTTLTGSGPGGRIVRKDVEGAESSGKRPAKPKKEPQADQGGGGVGPKAERPVRQQTAVSSTGGGDERIPLTGMRTIIAERLLASKTRIPHFYLNIEVDVGPLVGLRRQINEGVDDEGNKFTLNDFILKAVIGAAVAVPQVNASFDGDAIIQFGTVNLCVAIAIEDGLVTPVIRDAQTRTLAQLSRAVKDLARRARGKKLSPDEFQGGTLTVSNLGAYGIDNFDAIINPPQAVILSIGAAKARPVVDASGAIVAGQRMWIGMSCDHRVVDGAIGAGYLAELRKRLENPALTLV